MGLQSYLKVIDLVGSALENARADKFRTWLRAFTTNFNDLHRLVDSIAAQVAELIEGGTTPGGSTGSSSSVSVFSDTLESMENGEYIDIEHDAVPLSGANSDHIMFGVTAFASGKEHSGTGNKIWNSENLNVNSATWHTDTVIVSDNVHIVSGHFSVDPGPKVKLGAAILDDDVYNIIMYGEDPTVEDSVTLYCEYNEPVSQIEDAYVIGARTGYSSLTNCYFQGYDVYNSCYYIGYTYAISEPFFDYISFEDIVDFYSSVGGYLSYGSMAVSPDDGDTWYAWNGIAWVVVDVNNLTTEGMRISSYGVSDSSENHNALDSTAYEALKVLCDNLGEDLSFRMCIGFDTNGNGGSGSYIEFASVYWKEKGRISAVPTSFDSEMNKSVVIVNRISETVTRFVFSKFEYGYGKTLSDFLFKVFVFSAPPQDLYLLDR